MQYFLAVRLKKLTELRSIIQDNPTVVSLVGKDGFTGLQLACKYGSVDVVKELIDAGASIEDVDMKYSRTSVHWASLGGHTAILSLFRGGARFDSVINAADIDGCTPLMLACRSGRVDTVRLLLSSGARTDISTPDGKTAFNMCNGSTEMLEALSTTHPHLQGPSTPSSDDVQWGISTGALLGKANANKVKVITTGWITITEQEQDDTSTSKGTTVQAIVKLNKHPRELQAEIATRALLEGTPLASSVVAVLHPEVLTTPDSLGHAILLDKGIIDVHHLYDAMCQGATTSRLTEVAWRCQLASRVCTIALQFVRQGLVWYDMKPSNFIVFPNLPDTGTTTSLSDTEPSGASREQSDCLKSTKTYLWLQRCKWEPSDFVVKAADLGSVYAIGSVVPKAEISCTARFLAPQVARVLRSAALEAPVSTADMLWSLAMTVMQLLHGRNRTFYTQNEFGHSEEVYVFLTESDAFVRDKVEEYARTEVAAQLVQGQAAPETGLINSARAAAVVDGLCRLLRFADSDGASAETAVQSLINALETTDT